MLVLSLSDKFCCFGIFVFVFNRFLFSRFSFLLVFIIFFVLVLVFVNENHIEVNGERKEGYLPIAIPDDLRAWIAVRSTVEVRSAAERDVDIVRPRR